MTDMARMVEEFGEAEGAQIVALARFLRQDQAPPPRRLAVAVVSQSSPSVRPTPRRPVAWRSSRRTIAAVAGPDDPELRAKAADVIAVLAAIKPRTPVESGLAGLFVMMERAAFDCMAGARIAGFDSLMGMTLLGRADKLTCRATELAEALDR